MRNSPGEFRITFVLYADTLLSITQIAGLLSPCYTTLHDQLREFESAFCRSFPTVWARIAQTVDGPTQVDKTQQVCSGFKCQDPPREGLDRGGSPEGGRTRWKGRPGRRTDARRGLPRRASRGLSARGQRL